MFGLDKSISSAGGKARAKIQKEEARKRIDEYNKHPNICKNCGKPILAPYDKRLTDTKSKKFCSRSCATSFNNKLHPKNVYGIGLLDKETIISKYTDEEIVKIFNESLNVKDFGEKLGYPSLNTKNNQVVNNKLRELGLDISSLMRQKTIESIDNTTKKELFEIRNSWQTARNEITKNARKVYQNSDKEIKCFVCGYDKHVEIAHIKAVSDFSGESLISEINNIDNLIALCPNHHWEYDHGLLDISNYVA